MDVGRLPVGAVGVVLVALALVLAGTGTPSPRRRMLAGYVAGGGTYLAVTALSLALGADGRAASRHLFAVALAVVVVADVVRSIRTTGATAVGPWSLSWGRRSAWCS